MGLLSEEEGRNIRGRKVLKTIIPLLVSAFFKGIARTERKGIFKRYRKEISHTTKS
jgi:hypothetical protein